MTPNDVRVRLAAVLAIRQPVEKVDCPHCNGSGIIDHRAKMYTQAQAARAAGVSRTQIANFVIGRTDLSFPVGLRLIDWIEEKERDAPNAAATPSIDSETSLVSEAEAAR